MKLKDIVPKDISQHISAFIARWFITALVLGSIVLISYTPNFNKYGLSKTGRLYHAYLDYPNEISSADALELSDFIESLNEAWNTDKKTLSLSDEKDDEIFWLKEVDVKDSFKRSQVIRSIAKMMGLSEDKFPYAHSHHTITDKLKNQIHQSIIFSSNHLHMNNLPHSPHINQCDMKKLNHHKSTVVTFSSKQYQSTHIKLDGLFSESGGKINFRMATPTEELYLKDNIKFNLTLFAQSNDPFKDVTISQIDHEVSSIKDIHIKSHHILDSCLVYHLDIIFPSKLKTYKQLDIKVNHAHQIQGDLESIVFKQFSVGLGRGTIDFKNLYADEMILGTLNGVILGHYFPIHKLGAASVNGATNLKISPQSTYLKSTVVSLNGPVKALVDHDKTVSQSGGFTVHCWSCEPAIVSNDSLIHITSSKRKSIKTGYHKERVNAYINVHSRQGESKLVYV